MLDSDLKKQLNSLFAPITEKIQLVYHKSSHAAQAELVQMLEAVSETSLFIEAIESATETSAVPHFRIHANGQLTGVSFIGIPGGHEFSSLVLAILNSAKIGKFPDARILGRIRKLKGPIRIQTYISLTCENCPDVVQALNLMALVHSDFHHEMIDGSYVQERVSKLGIQGVPSVMVGEELLHSGKVQLIDLLGKLEQKFGSNFDEEEVDANLSTDLGRFDAVVIGGGPAGVSAAIYSARKGLKTALIAERIGGQVQDTKGIENLISVVYTEGPQLAAQLQQHLQSYPIQIFEHRRVKQIILKEPSNASAKKMHQIDLEGGEQLFGSSIIIATGAKWRELGVPGEKEYLGHGVAFCPHCDGPYYKGKKIAVVGGGNSGVEAAIDLAGIVNEVILFEFAEALRADKVLVDKMKSIKNISYMTSVQIKEISGDGKKVKGLRYLDRIENKEKTLDLDGVFVQIGLVPNSQFMRGVVETSKNGEIVVDSKGRTSVPGIYAAGDVTITPYKQIIIAMGEGAKAALASFEDQMIAMT